MTATPGFDDYRRWLDTSLPGLAHRLVMHKGDLLSAPEVERNIRAQTVPAALNLTDAQISQFTGLVTGFVAAQGYPEKPFCGASLQSYHNDTIIEFLKNRQSAMESGNKGAEGELLAVISYLIAPDMDDVEVFLGNRLAQQDALKLNFNAAASDPGIISWLTFFHETAHAINRMVPGGGAFIFSDYMEQAHETGLTETACDTFATLMALKQFGDETRPTISTFADMRAIGFKKMGFGYYCEPAMRSAIAAVDARGPEWLNGLDAVAIFKEARNIAIAHFPTRDDIASEYFIEAYINNRPIIGQRALEDIPLPHHAALKRSRLARAEDMLRQYVVTPPELSA